MSAIDNLLARLSSAYKRETGSNNEKLLQIPASELDVIKGEITNIQDAHYVDNATGKSLDYLGSLLQSKRMTGENDDDYRARLKTQFKKYITSSTIDDVKETIATVLNVSTNRVIVKEDFSVEYARFDIWIWMHDFTNAGITISDLNQLVSEVKAAGVRAEVYKLGTFEHRSAGQTSDPTRGYNDTLNSNPNGGTYAGLLT
jgi:hypothetical protein